MEEEKEIINEKPSMGQMLGKTKVRVALALVVCALWGSAFPCIKIGYEWLDITTTGSQILFAGYRFFLAGATAFVIGCILEKKVIRIEKKAVPSVMLLGLIQTTIQYVTFYISLGYVTGTKGSIINGTSTFFAIILAHFILKDEKLVWKKTIGCIVGFLGIILINIEGIGGDISFMGEGMMLLSAIASGVGTTYLKTISNRGTPITLVAYQMMFGSVILIIIGIMNGGYIPPFGLKEIILMAYMVFVSTAAFTIWTALIKYNTVFKVTIFNFTIPVFGVIMSGIFLSESIFELKNLLALGCVSLGIIIVNMPSKSVEGKI